MKRKFVLFEQTLPIVLERVRKARHVSHDITLVRDIRGRIRVLLTGRSEDFRAKKKELKALGRSLSESLGVYGFAPDDMVLYSSDLAVETSHMDKILIAQDEDLRVFLLDRQITGQDWLRETWRRSTANPRVTFFGIKGGVGRSTALIIWAWHLAKQGKRVMVFDLDLESPGASTTLLPTENLPDFGIVDWFVEDGVRQADQVETEMRAKSPLASSLPGEILVVPAFGSKTGDYMSKLARCYSPGVDPEEGWGRRTEKMVARIEEIESPDIVILDSRAGIHDIAAAAVTRMDAQTFLFAVDSRQTWKAYEFLFQSWKNHPQVRRLRERLQIVASMIPEKFREQYIKRFRENAWDLFRDHLYDEATADATDAFNFDLDDPDGPHNPLPIFWHRALQEFDPASQISGIEEKTSDEALGMFMDAADRLVPAPGEEPKE
jgi:hypothetical protein